MKISVFPSPSCGALNAVASKSVAHRLLICAAFADRETQIRCEQTNKDIEATVACLNALGASIVRRDGIYFVTPTDKKSIHKKAVLPAGESGSTLRFLLPITAMLGAECVFSMEGRLSERPLSPLAEELETHGASLVSQGNLLYVHGKLDGAHYSIDGGVSSQFVSGLLFAMSLCDTDTTLTVSGKIESAPYIKITEDALAEFGIHSEKTENTYQIKGSQKFTSPLHANVEGDWSGAAFILSLAVLGGKEVRLGGLKARSAQGDSSIVDILKSFGGNIAFDSRENIYIAKASALTAVDIDASQIPDLVPVLAAVACFAEGKTRIYNAGRLKIKESDRLQSTSEMLSALGADITQTDDGLVIIGKKTLAGGSVSSCNDHRIAMSAAVAAMRCKAEVIIDGAEAVAKSYPSFWQDIRAIGVNTNEIS